MSQASFDLASTNNTIAFVGAGNMAVSFIGGLVKCGFPADRIRASDPHLVRRDLVNNRFGVTVSPNNAAMVLADTILVLAVKPQEMESVCRQINEAVANHRPLVISIAAGITTELLQRWLGAEVPVVRAMPNTPALVGVGAAALYAPDLVDKQQRQRAQAVLEAVGTAQWVQREAQMDVVTALSGSGPAYFFLLMEALRDAAIGLGMRGDVAEQLVQQTALGAATLIQSRNIDAATLRRQVTSPGGTTERAIKALEQADYREIVRQAIEAATERGRQMAQEMNEEPS